MASKVHCLLFVKKKFNRAILLITIVSFAVCKESKNKPESWSEKDNIKATLGGATGCMITALKCCLIFGLYLHIFI